MKSQKEIENFLRTIKNIVNKEHYLSDFVHGEIEALQWVLDLNELETEIEG